MKVFLVIFHPFFRFQESASREQYRCCGQENCMSLTERVGKLLDPEILEIQLAARYSSREDHNQLLPENFRYVAYRNLFFLVYGRTKANQSRMPLPDCLVQRVRASYPDPNNTYTGFQIKKKKRCK